MPVGSSSTVLRMEDLDGSNEQKCEVLLLAHPSPSFQPKQAAAYPTFFSGLGESEVLQSIAGNRCDGRVDSRQPPLPCTWEKQKTRTAAVRDEDKLVQNQVRVKVGVAGKK